jgi:hypothetical protein
VSKWHVSTDVLSTSGVQVWEVEADTESEALAMVARGEGECVAEEIEVRSCGEPYGAERVEGGTQ